MKPEFVKHNPCDARNQITQELTRSEKSKVCWLMSIRSEILDV
jgi:hypothetical protein